MKYVPIISMLLWSLAGSVFAAPEKAQVLELLEGRHWSLNAETFRQLGEGTDQVLIEIAADATLINYLRFRALEALTLFSTERTATFLEATAKVAFAPLARRGFEALARGFSKTRPQRVQQAASRLLSHRNAQIRVSAARVLRPLDALQFQRFLKTEQDAWVRKAARE